MLNGSPMSGSLPAMVSDSLLHFQVGRLARGEVNDVSTTPFRQINSEPAFPASGPTGNQHESTLFHGRMSQGNKKP